MLLSLSIENYALINKIQINFNSGFSVITGETGAGKSIIMDAMGLVLGQRADTNVLLDKSKKCIIEASFDITAYKLKEFFDEHDIDYEQTCIIVRQITPNGKSRAFINDVPCQLAQLKSLGQKLIDIHSQNSNKLLDSPEFHLFVVDNFVGNSGLIDKYKVEFKIFKRINSELQELLAQQLKDTEEKEYYSFLFEELDKLKLKQDELSSLENEFEFLTHSEEIQQNLSAIFNLYSEGEMSIESQLKEAVQKAETIKQYFKPAEAFHGRLNSALIELNDIAKEIEITGNDIEYDPERLQLVRERLDTIYNLMQKHKVNSGGELLCSLPKAESGISNESLRTNQSILTMVRRAALWTDRTTLPCAGEGNHAENHRDDSTRRPPKFDGHPHARWRHDGSFAPAGRNGLPLPGNVGGSHF